MGSKFKEKNQLMSKKAAPAEFAYYDQLYCNVPN